MKISIKLNVHINYICDKATSDITEATIGY